MTVWLFIATKNMLVSSPIGHLIESASEERGMREA